MVLDLLLLVRGAAFECILAGSERMRQHLESVTQLTEQQAIARGGQQPWGALASHWVQTTDLLDVSSCLSGCSHKLTVNGWQHAEKVTLELAACLSSSNMPPANINPSSFSSP